jgi:acyl-CoA thioesterase I
MQRLSLVLLFLVMAAAVPGGSQAQTAAEPPEVAPASVACNLPAEFTTPDEPLTHVGAALAAGHAVEILAIGSGSTVGDSGGAGGPAFVYSKPTSSFPYRMQQALQAAKPGVTFHVTVKGGRNMTTDEMLPVMQKELSAHHYDLVLWQTGTVEAVRGLRPEAMRDVLEQGIDAAETSGADVVVIDPQFSRFLRANTDLSPYEAALQQITTMTSAALFRRFDLTHLWASDGDIDLERVSRNARDHTISVLNICLGRALAKFVLAGAGEKPN